MRAYFRWMTFVSLMLSGQLAWGQSDALQLRQQIELLQKQLQRVEAAQADARVTQIGGKRAGGREPELTVRIYDLSDLFAVAPMYPARYPGVLGSAEHSVFPQIARTSSGGGHSGGFGGMMGGGAGFFAVPEGVKLPVDKQHLAQFSNGNGGEQSAEARTSMDTLIEAITTTISPTSWDETGGPGSIAQMGTSLIISTDRQNHEQIEELLSLFRKKWGTLRTISTRATWLWLTDEQLARLLPGDASQKAGDLEAYGIVDEPAWKKLQGELAAAGGDQRGGYRAIVTCYNGQTVSTVSGSQTLVVTQIEPVVVKGDGEKKPDQLALRPVSLPIQEGAALQITPAANTSGKIVVLDVHSRINKLRDRSSGARAADRKPLAAGDAPEKLLTALDRPLVLTSELATTLRVPVDHTFLVGGMTFESEPRPGEPNLYLFVKLSVQELRDDVQRNKAEPAPAAEPPKNGPAAKAPAPAVKTG